MSWFLPGYFISGAVGYFFLLWVGFPEAAVWFCGFWLGLFFGAIACMYLFVEALAEGPGGRYYAKAHEKITKAVEQRRKS
jgi:hypothetical protein